MKLKLSIEQFKKPLGYLVGDIANKAIPFLLLPLIANKVPMDSYGYYSTEVIIYSFFCSLLTMGLQAKIILDISKDEAQSDAITSNVLVVFSFTSILLTCLFYLSKGFFISFISSQSNISSVFWCAVIQSFVSIFITKYQATDNVKKFVTINFTYTVAYFSGLVYSLYADDWIHVWSNILALYVLTSLIIFTYVYIHRKKNIKFNIFKCISKCTLYESFIFGLYQLPHVLSSWIRLGYDRLILADLISMNYVAGYSAAIQVSLISSVIFQSLNRFWTPFFMRKIRNRENQKKIIYVGGLIVVITTLLNIVFGYAYFNLFLPNDYSSFTDIIPILCSSYMFQGFYFLIVNYIYYYDSNKFISIPSIASITIHIFIAPILIKNIGYYGAAMSLLISWMSLFAFTTLIILFIKRNRHA